MSWNERRCPRSEPLLPLLVRLEVVCSTRSGSGSAPPPAAESTFPGANTPNKCVRFLVGGANSCVQKYEHSDLADCLNCTLRFAQVNQRAESLSWVIFCRRTAASFTFYPLSSTWR